MSSIRQLGKQSLIYALGSVAQGIVGFILIPLYTSVLVPADYGFLEILNNLSAILVILVALGFNSAILKSYYRDTSNEEDRKKLLGTAVLVTLIFSTLIVAILFILQKPLSALLLEPGREQAFTLMICSVWFIALMNPGLALLRSQQRAVRYTIISSLRFLSVLGFNLLFVWYFKMGLSGILWANLFSYIIVVLGLLPDLLWARLTIAKNLLGKLLAFGLPLLPASLAVWALDLADRFLIKTLRGPADAGVYALGYKFGYLLDLVLVAPFQLAWPAIYFSIARRPDAHLTYARLLIYFTALGSLAALILSLFADNIIHLFAQHTDYYAAAPIIPFIAFSYVLYGIHFIVVVGLHLANKNKWYPAIIIIPAILNIIGNLFLIPVWGILGAAAMTALAFLGVAILAALFANRFYPIRYPISKVVFIITLAAAFTLPFFLGWAPNTIWLKSVTILFYLTILVTVKIISLGEIKAIPQLLGFARRNSAYRSLE